MRKSTKVVALDIRKDPITAVLAGEDRRGPRLYGTMPLSTGEALSKLADPWDVVAVLLRGRSLWIRRLPSAQGPGARLHGGGALADPPQAGRPHQDRSPRCAVAGATFPKRRVDPGVGARRSAGGDARSGALPGRLQAHRASHTAAPQQVPVASRSDLSRSQPACSRQVAGRKLTFAGWRSSTRKRPGRWRRA